MEPQAPSTRSRGRRREQRNFRSAGLVVLLLAVVWFGVQKAGAVINGRLTPTVEAMQGVVKREVPVNFLVLREETVLVTRNGGRLEQVALEGDRVRVGSQVARILPADGRNPVGLSGVPNQAEDVVATAAGMVCFHPDGLEGAVTAQTVKDLDWDILAQMANAEIPSGGGDVIPSGRAVAKIINNLFPPLLVAMLTDQALNGQLKAGQALQLEWADGHSASSRVEMVRQRGVEVDLLIRLADSDSVPHGRKIPARLVLEQYQGVVVPEEALVEQKGLPGVMVTGSLGVSWQPVSVKARMDGKAVIEGLRSGTRVLARPNRQIPTN